MKLRAVVIIIAMFAIAQSAMGYKYEKSKVIEKIFDSKEGVELSISNKYGDITINSWEKDQVKITATIIVYSKKDVVTERLDNIDIRFSNNSHSISAETRVIEKMKRPDYSYSITYQILAPKYIHQDINNYNGDIYIGDCSGNITSDSKYGDLILNNTNSPEININAYNGDIDIRNSGENTGALNLENKYGNLDIDGYYNSADIEIYNGDTDIQNKNLDAIKTKILSKYGDVSLNGNSKEIDINSYNGDVTLGAETNAQITNINNKYGNIELMGKSKNITIESYNGNVSIANESTPGNVVIINKYGSIEYIGGFTMIAVSNYNGDVSIENTCKGEDFGTIKTSSNLLGENITITGGEVGGGNISSQYGNIQYTGPATTLNITNYNGNISVNKNSPSMIKYLMIKNAYGRIDLNNIENIRILNTNNDTYNIQNSKSVSVESGRYSSLDIDGLKENFTTTNQVRFLKIDAKGIDPKIKTINISNSYSPINLSFIKANDYKMNISGKFGGVEIADALKNSSIKISEDDSKSVYSAKQEGSGGSIVVDNQYGDIRLELEY